MLAFFDTYDLLLTPATVVAPFPIENRYVAELNGHKFANYVEWLRDRLCDHGRVRPRAVAALRLHAREPAGRPADRRRRRAARRASSRAAKALEDILGIRGMTPIDPRVMRLT